MRRGRKDSDGGAKEPAGYGVRGQGPPHPRGWLSDEADEDLAGRRVEAVEVATEVPGLEAGGPRHRPKERSRECWDSCGPTHKES